MTEGGFIYAICKADSAYVKIGCTRTTLQRRLTALKRELRAPISLIAVVSVAYDVWLVEQFLHRRLKRYRIAGEWFALEMDQDRLESLVAATLDYLEQLWPRKA